MSEQEENVKQEGQEQPTIPRRPEFDNLSTEEEFIRALGYTPIPDNRDRPPEQRTPDDHFYIKEVESVPYGFLLCVRVNIGKVAQKPPEEWSTIIWVAAVPLGVTERPELLPEFNLQVNPARQFLSQVNGRDERNNLKPDWLHEGGFGRIADIIAYLEESGHLQYLLGIPREKAEKMYDLKKEGGLQRYIDFLESSQRINRDNVIAELQKAGKSEPDIDNPLYDLPEDHPALQLTTLWMGQDNLRPDIPIEVGELIAECDRITLFYDAGFRDGPTISQLARELTELHGKVVKLKDTIQYPDVYGVHELLDRIETILGALRSDYKENKWGDH